jgi:transcriptional regulator with XRE-family HTH domain
MPFDPTPLLDAAAQPPHRNRTLTSIADRLGVPYGTLRRWTSGRNVPNGPALARIERTYGVTAAQLWPDKKDES